MASRLTPSVPLGWFDRNGQPNKRRAPRKNQPAPMRSFFMLRGDIERRGRNRLLDTSSGSNVETGRHADMQVCSARIWHATSALYTLHLASPDPARAA
jgi:hypothetical protein